jgi:hypothetical protein
LANVVQDMLTIRMDFASFADFWAPSEGTVGPVAQYVATLAADARTRLHDMVRLAYLDGEGDGPRSYAATAWVVKGSRAESRHPAARSARREHPVRAHGHAAKGGANPPASNNRLAVKGQG